MGGTRRRLGEPRTPTGDGSARRPRPLAGTSGAGDVVSGPDVEERRA